MQWSELPFRPSSRTLRQFAGLCIVFFGVLACWQWFGHGRGVVALALLGLALTIGPMGLLRPQWIRPIFVGWLCLAFPIGWVVSHLVLACLFYGLFTPLGLLFRLIGRDALALRPHAGDNSYWRPKPTARDAGDYLRQS